MTKALTAYHEATYGGVYYSANIDFTNALAVPTWTKLADTGLDNLLVKVMQNDYADPYNKIYVQLDNDDVYLYNGAGWTKILDLATARTLSGLADGEMGYVAANRTVAGRVYVPINNNVVEGATQVILISSDYGANWSAVDIIQYDQITGIGFVSASGDNIWLCYGHLYRSMQYSDDNGATWKGDWAIWGDSGGGGQPNINPFDGTYCYYRTASGDADLSKFAYSGGYADTQLQDGVSLASSYINTTLAGCHFLSKKLDGYQKIVISATRYLYSTSDGWTTLTEASPTQWGLGLTSIIAIDACRENELYTLIGIGNVADGDARLYAWVGDDTSDAPWIVAGANYAAAPYADSIPSPNDMYLAVYGVYAGEAPASTGIEIYSVEHNAYDVDHTPKRGDRSSWRDMDADTNDAGDPASYSHAEDIYEGTPQRHAPWSTPAPAAGYGIVSDGAKWIISTDELALEGDLHDAVTLDVDAAVILDLTGQEIGLDTQAANAVLAGPAAGAANEPTFRALVLADLPAIALDNLSDVDTTGVADGDVIIYDLATFTWKPGTPFDTSVLHEHVINEDHSAQCNGVEDTFLTFLDFRLASTAVYLNGVRQRLGTHYTEAAGLDSVVFGTPPETGDELVIDYIISYADYVAYMSFLLVDSDGEWLTDSDGEYLVDSDG